jgi:hypothetical protein
MGSKQDPLSDYEHPISIEEVGAVLCWRLLMA